MKFSSQFFSQFTQHIIMCDRGDIFTEKENKILVKNLILMSRVGSLEFIDFYLKK